MMDDLRLQELFHAYHKTVYRLAANRLYTYTGGTEDAQDVVQDVFLLAARKDIHRHPNPGGWLVVATNNICMNYIKADRSRKRRMEITATGPGDPPTFAMNDITENVDILLTLKSVLSPEDLKIVVDHYVHRRSLSDIAAEMGASHAAIRVRIHRIRLRLKKIFSAG